MSAAAAACAAALTLLAGGCALTVQEAGAPGPAFDGPRLEADAIVSFDGGRLGLQTWLPDAAPWAVIIGVHGMGDYADTFYLAGPWWAERGAAVYAYDQRGFGRSPGRGIWPGAELMARDLETVVALARARHPDLPVAVVGVSMGAATVMAAGARVSGPLADRVVLTAPGVMGWSTLPWHYKASLAVAARLAPGRTVRPPRGVRIQVTDNIETLYKNGRDPLVLHDTRIDMLHGLISLMEEAAQASPGTRAPTLLQYGAKDELIPARSVTAAAARMGPCSRSVLYPDGWHMLLRDLHAEVVWRDILAFIADPTAPPPSGGPPVPHAPDGSTLIAPCARPLATPVPAAFDLD